MNGAGAPHVDYRVATVEDGPALAALRWRSEVESGPVAESCEAFVPEFLTWMRGDGAGHTPFVAVTVDDGLIGMAWLARVPRPASPAALHRVNGDLQTVYVVPEHRGAGVGEAVVRTLLQHAWDQGMGSVTVTSGRRAMPLYRRIGFAGQARDLRLAAPDP